MENEERRAVGSGDPDRVTAAQALLAAVAHTEKTLSTATAAKNEQAVAPAHADFGMLLSALRDHGRKYRRGLVPKGELAEGVIRPWNLQPKGGGRQFEREHVVPVGCLPPGWEWSAPRPRSRRCPRT